MISVWESKIDQSVFQQCLLRLCDLHGQCQMYCGIPKGTKLSDALKTVNCQIDFCPNNNIVKCVQNNCQTLWGQLRLTSVKCWILSHNTAALVLHQFSYNVLVYAEIV